MFFNLLRYFNNWALLLVNNKLKQLDNKNNFFQLAIANRNYCKSKLREGRALGIVYKLHDDSKEWGDLLICDDSTRAFV